MSAPGPALDPRRLHAGEWLAAAGAAVLLGSLFLDWYAVRAGPGAPSLPLTGWEAFGVTDALLTVVAACGLALAVVTAVQRGPTLPLAAGVIAAVAGSAGVLLVALRLLDAPGPDDLVALRAGAFAGLAGALGVAAGAWLALRDEAPRSRGEAAVPELRPAPPREPEA
jgi:hypothetical protein